MNIWLVRVTAEAAYLGNPDDPLHWHFLSPASTPEQAVRLVREALNLNAAVRIEAFAR